MTMSKDRVRFKFSDNCNQRRENTIAAAKAFGIQKHVACGLFDKGAEIVCRPSQFARFIVYRMEEGVTINRIAQMVPELFYPGDQDQPLDVSNNPSGC